MKKRKFLVYENYHRSGESLILSYKDKEYKIYDFNNNDNFMFYPEDVKIEQTDDSSLFVRFGKLYKRCAINDVTQRKYFHKKYNMHVAIPFKAYGRHVEFFDDLNTAKLWVEVHDKENTKACDSDCEACEGCEVEVAE